MKVRLRNIFAFLLIFLIFVLAITNLVLTKYGKEHIELLASKVFGGDVAIGRLYLNTYPPSIALFDVKIKRNDKNHLLKNLNINLIDIDFDKRTLFSDLLIINYFKVIGLEVELDIAALDIKYSKDGVLEDVPADVEGEGVKESAKPTLKIVDMQKIESQKDFIINRLDITGGNVLPLGENMWLRSGEKLDFQDIKLEKIDRDSGFNIDEAIIGEVKKSVKEKLNSEIESYNNRLEQAKEDKEQAVQ